jgi:hypothetical protein
MNTDQNNKKTLRRKSVSVSGDEDTDPENALTIRVRLADKRVFKRFSFLPNTTGIHPFQQLHEAEEHTLTQLYQLVLRERRLRM